MNKRKILLISSFFIIVAILIPLISIAIREIYTNKIINIPFQILASLIIVSISYLLYRKHNPKELVDIYNTKFNLIGNGIIINYILLFIFIFICILSNSSPTLDYILQRKFVRLSNPAGLPGFISTIIGIIMMIIIGLVGVKSARKIWQTIFCWAFINFCLISLTPYTLGFNLDTYMFISKIICINILLIIIKQWKT